MLMDDFCLYIDRNIFFINVKNFNVTFKIYEYFFNLVLMKKYFLIFFFKEY